MTLPLPIFQAYVGGAAPLPRVTYLGAQTSGYSFSPSGSGLVVLVTSSNGSSTVPSGFSAIGSPGTVNETGIWYKAQSGAFTVGGVTSGNLVAAWFLQNLRSNSPIAGAATVGSGIVGSVSFNPTTQAQGILIAGNCFNGATLASWSGISLDNITGQFAAGHVAPTRAGSVGMTITASTPPAGGSQYSWASWR